MAWWNDPAFLSRLQFAWTIGFHIIFPTLTIGLSVFLVLAEALWLRTGDVRWYRHARFWGRIFLLNFTLGVVTGVVMEFQFGMNWSEFSRVSGDFFGNILGFEGAMAFAAEAAFLAIMMWGWHRVSRPLHLFATVIVAFAASLSAFWIMDANSWMQIPRGVEMQAGQLVTRSHYEAIFNPDWLISFAHMWVACLEISLFVVAGISAWYMLKGRHTGFFLMSFKVAVATAIVVTPLQIYLGDVSTRTVIAYQPAKSAAAEAHWNTNPPGTGASWALVAWPDSNDERNAFEIRVPYVLSLLSTHSLTGEVKGLKEFPSEDRPPIVMPFYAFRVMVGLGFLMVALMLWTVWRWLRGGLTEARVRNHRRLLWAWLLLIPAPYVAMETGWIVREVGRQPWTVYGLVRTNDATSNLSGATVLASLIVYVAVYTILALLCVAFLRYLLRTGPDVRLEPLGPRDRRGPGRRQRHRPGNGQEER